MLEVCPPVLLVGRGDLAIADDDDVLRVPFLGGFREIEGAGYHAHAVDDNDLIVRDRVFRVDVGLDPVVSN